MPSQLIIGLGGMVLFGGSLYIFIRLIMKESEKFNKKGDSHDLKQIKKIKTY